MTTTAVEMAQSKEVQDECILQDFVVSNTELQELERLLQKFNLFEALRLEWHEVRHSDFLAYLIDPHQNHGLADRVLKTFLQSALKGSIGSGVSPIHIDIWNLTSAEVAREWSNIDIFIRDEANRLAVIVENKIRSSEHSNQLVRYYDCVSHECAGWQIIPIYLTIEGAAPSDERFIPMSYSDVSRAVKDAISFNRGSVDPDIRVFVEHYIEMLRRHLVADSEISELCRRIYSKHRQALDLIYEHRPDRQQMVRDFIEGWLRQRSDEYSLDHCTKSYVRFLPKMIDTETLRQGKGWTPSGRILLFEAENTEDHLRVKVVIGPGPEEIRRKLFDMAHARKPPFKPFAKFYAQWNTIGAHNLLTAKDYELRDGDLLAHLEKQWTRFIEKELPPMVEAFEKERWIYGKL